MAFGQQSGRPANGRQVKQLEELLARSGYTGFRDARGPLGLTQRQGGGKFTDDEATELAARLERELEAAAEVAELEAMVNGGSPAPGGTASASQGSGATGSVRKTSVPKASAPKVSPKAKPAPSGPVAGGRDADRALLLKRMPDELLVAELERRGWTLIAPS